jgi:transcription-repair coupling factor (superfamily II helicase)
MNLIQTARKRISAIKQYSSLGSGFKIAMRDLEIRGAAISLGSEQSGPYHRHRLIFTANCFQESIARLKGHKMKRLPQVTMKLDFMTDESGESLGRIPANYITENRLRIQAYRKIASVSELPEAEALRREFRDRYGKLTREVRLLLQAAEVKVLAGQAHVDTVETKEDKIMLTSRGQLFQVGGKFPRMTSDKPEGKLQEIKALLKSLEATNEPDSSRTTAERKSAN